MTNPPTPLVGVDQLRARLDSPDRPAVLDVRWAGPGSHDGGRAAFRRGHIPGAAFVDLDNVLSGPASATAGGRHPLPTPERFQTGMRAAGISASRGVVVYDDWQSIAAARAWWLLRHHGHGDVAVLDGGLGAWVAAGGELETGEEDIPAGDFVASAPRLPVVDAAGAARVAAEGTLLDGRPAGRFRGEGETVDPIAGHIPGANSLPALCLVDATGHLLPPHVLRDRFAAVGGGTTGRVAAYCGSGVQACHLALAARAAGLGDIELYAGSWSDWITDPSRPVA